MRELQDHKTLGLKVHNDAIGDPKIVVHSKTVTDPDTKLDYETIDNDRLMEVKITIYII